MQNQLNKDHLNYQDGFHIYQVHFIHKYFYNWNSSFHEHLVVFTFAFYFFTPARIYTIIIEMSHRHWLYSMNCFIHWNFSLSQKTLPIHPISLFHFSFLLCAYLDAFFINSLTWCTGLHRYDVKYVSIAYILVTYCKFILAFSKVDITVALGPCYYVNM